MSSARPTHVVQRVAWAEDLISLVLEARLEGFRPGQFVRAGFMEGERFVGRAYSLASSPGTQAELLLSLVPEGTVTPPLFGLPVGAPLFLGHAIAGHFTLDLVPPAHTLWLVATGAGLAPFMSMLRSRAPWEKFTEVVVVHGVRRPEHLAYAGELRAMPLRYVRTVSRGRPEGALEGRLTTALIAGVLEEVAGLPLDAESSQVMLCGNPAMVEEMTELLLARGLAKNRAKAPGQITTEPYW